MSDDFDNEVTKWTGEGNSGKLSVGEAIELAKNLPLKETVEGVFGSLRELIILVREAKITDRELARYRLIRDKAIAEITKRHEDFNDLVKITFEERRKFIEKYFEVIDKGLEENNFQLISTSLQHATTFGMNSPLKELIKILELPPAEQLIILENGDYEEI